MPSGGILYHAIAGLESGREFHHGAQVSLQRHGLHPHAIVAAHRGDGQSLGIENQRTRGHADDVGHPRDLQVDARIAAGHQLARSVVDDDLHQRRAGARYDGLGGSFDRSIVGFPGMLGNADDGLGARRNAWHIVLRHAHVDAQLARFGYDEQLRAARGAHVDERPDVGFARGDDAVERRDEAFEAFLRHQLVDIGLRRLDLGDTGVVGEGALVDVLLGDGIGAGQ